MSGFASLIERVFKRPAAAPKPPSVPVISLEQKVRMVAGLLDHPACITIAHDDASRPAVSLASSLADVFTRAGWRVTACALKPDEAGDVALAVAQAGALTAAESRIVTAWKVADLGPLRLVQGEPAADPELRISGRG